MNSDSTETQPTKIKSVAGATLARLARFMGFRVLMMIVTIVIAVYTTILIANMGGYVDTMMRNDIRESTIAKVAAMTANKPMTGDARKAMQEEMIALEIKRQGLDTPFIVRSFRYLKNALTLNLGRAIYMVSDHGSKTVRAIILERLPATLLLMGSSQLILFFSSVFLALILSRKYGSFWDKAVITLSPTSAAPPWFYGIFFILIFAAVFKILPFGGMVSSPPPDTTIGYSLDVLKHLILPGSALIISSFFLEHLHLADFLPDLFQ